jgi:hypothetical protein
VTRHALVVAMLALVLRYVTMFHTGAFIHGDRRQRQPLRPAGRGRGGQAATAAKIRMNMRASRLQASSSRVSQASGSLSPKGLHPAATHAIEMLDAMINAQPKLMLETRYQKVRS